MVGHRVRYDLNHCSALRLLGIRLPVKEHDRLPFAVCRSLGPEPCQIRDRGHVHVNDGHVCSHVPGEWDVAGERQHVEEVQDGFGDQW